MSNKIYQDYQNSGFYFSLEQVKARIEDLTTTLKSSESYYRRHQPEVLSKEQREDILLENEMQDEIDFYEHQILNHQVFGTRIRQEQDIQEEDAEEKALSSLSNADTIQHYHNSSLSISIIEAREIIQDLDRDLKGHRHYCKSSVRIFTEKEKEQQQEKDVNIQHEICYYETSIQQAYKDNAQSLSKRRTPSVSDSDSDEEEPVSRIDILEKKLTGVQDELYQIVGGIFNQKTQPNMIGNHLSQIYHGKTSIAINEEKESIWPTTRQGDQNEEEIQLLKQQVSKLEGTVEMLVRLLSEKLKN
jgi:hypothetical protein